MTPNEIIRQALGLIGCRAPGEAIGGDEMADCFSAFQTLIDEFSMLPLMKRWEGAKTFGTSAGVGDYTISTTGEASPVGVYSIGAVDNSGQSWQLEPMGREEYLQINDRDLQGRPSAFCSYVKDHKVTVSLWPVPDGSYTAVANIKSGLYAPAVTTNMDLPEGLKAVLIPSLAVKLAPMYEREAPQSVYLAASNAMRAYKRSNWQGIAPSDETPSLSR